MLHSDWLSYYESIKFCYSPLEVKSALFIMFWQQKRFNYRMMFCLDFFFDKLVGRPRGLMTQSPFGLEE